MPRSRQRVSRGRDGGLIAAEAEVARGLGHVGDQVRGVVSPHAQRLLCLAGASWSFDRAAAHLNEFCELVVCDNTIRAVCHDHGGAMRDWQRDGSRAGSAFRTATGEVEFQTDGTA